MLPLLPKLFGILGLLCITAGVFAKNEVRQDWIFVVGGIGLLIYSISLGDIIFMLLQIVFIGASGYEIMTLKRKTSKARRRAA